MKLSELKLHNFRNYGQADVRFAPGINVFIGNNAQGKTNLLESVYVLALARSHRTHNNRDLIKWTQDTAQVKGLVKKRTGDLHLELDLGRHGKRAKVNYLRQARLSSYVGQFNVVLFSPDDLSIVKGAPRIRRHFMNTEFSQMSNRYMYNVAQYKDILQQRNHYLKSLHYHHASDLVYLSVLSDQLAAFGAEIIDQRIRLLKRLEKWARKIDREISLATEHLHLKYETALKSDQTGSVKEIYGELKRLYANARGREIRKGTTALGPHRDDLRFIINGKDVQTFGSQGQQRTSALAIKLAEIDLMKEVTGEYPVLLLDDVLSELDNKRQTHLLRAIQNKVQTFITTTNLSGVARNLIQDPKIFRITHGTIRVSDE
ncbi:MAG: DNA replication/repair protein RecF [Acetilactobacillus jinshanensis]